MMVVIELVIIAETYPDASLLEVIPDRNLFLDKRNDFILLEVEELLLLHIDSLLKSVQLIFHRLLKAVFLQFLAHLVEVGLCA